MTGSQELDVVCYILAASAGCSILFNRNASSGGLDIVAKIMNKYLHMELGKAISLSGMCIALSAALVYDKKSVVLSVLGTYFNGLLLDHFILDRISSGECALLQNMKRNSEILFFIICTAGQRFTRLWALIIWKNEMKLSQLWIKVSTRSLWIIWIIKIRRRLLLCTRCRISDIDRRCKGQAAERMELSKQKDIKK